MKTIIKYVVSIVAVAAAATAIFGAAAPSARADQPDNCPSGIYCSHSGHLFCCSAGQVCTGRGCEYPR